MKTFKDKIKGTDHYITTSHDGYAYSHQSPDKVERMSERMREAMIYLYTERVSNGLDGETSTRPKLVLSQIDI